MEAPTPLGTKIYYLKIAVSNFKREIARSFTVILEKLIIMKKFICSEVADLQGATFLNFYSFKDFFFKYFAYFS